MTFAHAVQYAVLLAFAPLVAGIVKTLRARLQGRTGPSPVQPYRDLRKLMAKELLVVAHTSQLLLVVPGLILGISLTVAALVPSFFDSSALAFDAVAIALTLALGRFLLVLAALDTRSSFEAMAASREMSFAALSEAPLILALIAGAVGAAGTISGGLAAGALLLVLLFETARIPVDSQETHYELTMIHEGQILEFGGWQLAWLQYAGYVRQFALLALAAMLLPGAGLTRALWIPAFIVAGALVERSLAKQRLFDVPHIFTSATMLALAGIGFQIAGWGWW
jgi:formate hydrogenlyase subunit 4